MALLSALDDFSSRTLAAASGLLRKLSYLAELRNEGGSYSHWGLDKTHGTEAAQRAMAEAHSTLFLEVLRTPLSQLRHELSPEILGLRPDEGIPVKALVPEDLNGGSRRHFNSVLEALRAMAKRQTTDRVA